MHQLELFRQMCVEAEPLSRGNLELTHRVRCCNGKLLSLPTISQLQLQRLFCCRSVLVGLELAGVLVRWSVGRRSSQIEIRVQRAGLVLLWTAALHHFQPPALLLVAH